jgi:glutathione S-transferase
MTTHLTLVSHALCPYVQRVAIVLHEKGVPFVRRDIDLAAKPDWFLAVSPLGKTPVLLVDDAPLFESAVICEYLEDVYPPPLHPADPLRRARHRGWIEFASNVLNAIGTFYSAPDEAALQAAAVALKARFAQVEAALAGGPWFNGARFTVVDAAFAPAFRYLDVFDRIGDFDLLAGLPHTQAWRAALAARPSVKAAVGADYEARLMDFLERRRSALSARTGRALQT